LLTVFSYALRSYLNIVLFAALSVGVTKPKPQTLKDAIEKLSFEKLKQAFGAKYIEYREPESFPGYFPDPLSDLYNEFLEPKGIDKYKGIEQVYNLICEKIAMDWMNDNM